MYYTILKKKHAENGMYKIQMDTDMKKFLQRLVIHNNITVLPLFLNFKHHWNGNTESLTTKKVFKHIQFLFWTFLW